mmetsp:Transcript_99860/g.260341  ORF Transcript_99860/g.260341 Transcript_99860/m.260341 type:complete len:224 (+) Transcript_99860:838-1509(+)
MVAINGRLCRRGQSQSIGAVTVGPRPVGPRPLRPRPVGPRRVRARPVGPRREHHGARGRRPGCADLRRPAQGLGQALRHPGQRRRRPRHARGLPARAGGRGRGGHGAAGKHEPFAANPPPGEPAVFRQRRHSGRAPAARVRGAHGGRPLRPAAAPGAGARAAGARRRGRLRGAAVGHPVGLVRASRSGARGPRAARGRPPRGPAAPGRRGLYAAPGGPAPVSA